ncbi:TonB-dependent receptor [Flagellimonas sp. HMM57]|uniref:SusC/RagA family TonB-linked outer membrane protein n=1 Tax=unclassified Flagellimonas TaxID=2644544 RepID=UPI0013D8C25C|nr:MULTISPECIES: TonB-dependent receptor [unclassified Flagellimonas]UII77301.1 TonB-dependent receptor [Flagellimonas sp. HMM57]
MKLKLLLLLACTVSFASLAQTQITGVVLDENNAPLPGANVQEKGTTNGVVTDFDGNFIINVQDSNSILVISYIGFETKELTLDGSSNYTVQLSTSSTGLDEVVVIGYGSVKKSDLTGAVASLSNETVTEQRKTDIGQAIQGRVAGVDVRTLNSKPGAPLSIQIRGNTVITANQGSERDGVSDDVTTDPDQPLYVVDGVFFDNINVLNPADIEQIDILKDVSATAIYGARGANGVVIITTKNGIEGVSRFTYDATFGLRSATNLPDFFTGPEYVGFVDDVLRAREWLGTDLSIDAYNNVAIDRSTEFQTSNEEANNVANGRYTDWADLLRGTGIQTSHTVGISGGSNGLVYNGSLGYLKDEGVIGIEEFERYNISLSASKKLSDKFTLGIKTYLALSEREAGSPELFRSSLRLAPTVNPFDENGELILVPDEQDQRFINPFFEDQGSYTAETKSLDVIANVFLNYKPNNWFNFKTQFSPTVSSTRFGEFRGLLTRSSRNDPTRVRSTYDTRLRTSYTWDNIADFDFNIKEGHNLKTTLITSLFYDNTEGSDIETRNFDTDAFSFFNTEGGTDIRTFDTFQTQETLASFAARVNYNIKDKYLFTLTGRYDGSSKLAAGNQWDFFPSAAFAWRASQESFLKDVDWLNNLKFRVSYGESGNDNPVSAFSSFAFLEQSSFLFGSDLANGQFVQTLPNEELTWEVSRELNLGIDLAILSNRINLAFEYYNKTTDGSILARTLSSITGFGDDGLPTTIGNFGSVRNKGVEFTLNTVNVRTDNFSWRTSLNFSANDNEILELFGDTEQIPISSDVRFNGVLQEGAPIDAVWSYEVDGIYGTDDVAEAASFGFLPGQYRFVDQNDDGVINQEDRVVLGSQAPDWIAGMTNTFSYKNFELNVQVNTRQGTFGHSEFLQNFSTFQGDRAVFNSLDQNYWTPLNQDAEFPSPEYGEDSSFPWFNTSFDFVRVGNIGLGYTFSQSVLDKLKMSSFRLSLDVQNPFTFTDFAGPDPETGLQNSFGQTYAIKTFLFGLKVAY